MSRAAELTRREALKLILGAPLAAAACRGSRPMALPDGALLGADHALGHRVREHARYEVPTQVRQRVPVVVVGGGVAGLSAGWCLQRAGMQPGRDFVMLDMEAQPGGTARAGGSQSASYPWGAHYLPAPQQHHRALVALLREMGLVVGFDTFGDPDIDELHLCHDPQERIFDAGRWQEGLYPYAGADADDRQQLQRFLQTVNARVAWRDPQGRRAFTLPISQCSRAPECLALDALSADAWMAREGFTSPRLKWLVDYACRDDYGGTLQQVSAWSLLFYFASRVPRLGAGSRPIITWPEGNQRLVQALLRGTRDALVADTLVTEIYPEASEVVVCGLRDAQAVAWQAERVIFAGPQYVARHVVRPLRDAPQAVSATYSAWVVANLFLRGRPQEGHFPLAWDNVMFHSPSVGYVVNTHQQDASTGRTVFTYYYPLTGHTPQVARQMLMDLGHAHWAEAILADLSHAHPDLPNLVTRMDIWRWGHAMIRPDIGSFANPRRLEAALPVRGIHRAHSDLSGVALFEEAFDHGVRAAGEVLEARGMVLPAWS